MDQNLLSRLYGGFLGMNVGIRLGAPVEPGIWTVERIERTYGDIRGYIKEYKHFAADDDANGPVFFCAPWTTPAVRSLPPAPSPRRI